MFRYNLCFALIYHLLYSPAHANVPAAVHSPEASIELICHTSHASECYPAVFQPTIYFQRIHDDQSIPPGLHVRLNLATGLKEARLNVPEPDDAPKADLVLIDNPLEAPASGEQAPLTPDDHSTQDESKCQSREWQEHTLSCPTIDKPCIPTNETDEATYSLAQHSILKSTNVPLVLSSIYFLTNLAHDIEWGITLSRDRTLSSTLLYFIDPSSATPLEIRSASAALLGVALQNNAEALEALLKPYEEVDHHRNSPIEAVYAALKASMASGEQDILLQKRLLFSLAFLSPSLPQLQTFITNGGLSTLLDLFGGKDMEPEVDGRDIIRMKVANFLQDHVISTIGDWPGDSLLEELFLDPGSELMESQAIWRRALREMEGWCEAFDQAFQKYDIIAETPDRIPVHVDYAYLSIVEAHTRLKSVLRYQGCSGGCDCDFEKTFSSISN